MTITNNELGYFTKAEILEMFPSFGFKPKDNKPDILKMLTENEPPEEEAEVFKTALAAKIAEEAVEEKKPSKKLEYTVLHKISGEKIGGSVKKFAKGELYTGEHVKLFLRQGQIKVRD